MFPGRTPSLGPVFLECSAVPPSAAPQASAVRPTVPARVLAKARVWRLPTAEVLHAPKSISEKRRTATQKAGVFIKTFFKSHNFLIKRKYGKTPASGWASNLFLHQCRMQNWNWVQEFFWLWQLLLNGQVCITAGYGGGMMMVAQWLGGGWHGRRAGNGREVLWHSRVVARMGVWWGLDLGMVSPCYVAGEASVLMLCLLFGSSSRSRSWTKVESSLFKIKSWTKRNPPLLPTSYTSTLFRDINKKVN